LGAGLLFVVGCGDGAADGGGGASNVTAAATAPTATSASTSSSSATAGAGGGGACTTDVMPGDGVVVTDHGAVRGVVSGDTYAYRGIPYAAPPVGPLRWRPPAPAACFDGVRDAAMFGARCPQTSDNGEGEVVGDEDCLQLNVVTPRAASAEPRPILFWIHGGGFQSGSSSNETFGVNIYDPQEVVERTGVIVVTINYRLGPLGWLAHPTLAAEDSHQSTGNYGHLDQIAALAWVKANARAFGGDPDRVTIYGESAGGASVCNLISSPLAAGLFSGAIMQSGGCDATQRRLRTRRTRLRRRWPQRRTGSRGAARTTRALDHR
jgi:para-nitrobenzyl esterase